ncbi:hypothetical protein EVAR_87285_1 [Eumeta japonica]|uniref:Uncharacterized protein n=1 Tax=Eumeta variegata TaxID=151549 RepID=A0A4C1VUN5_EUMVA|nr:hypothetical protein EVAR_87285_1 [Eumeta japonica]
MKVLSEKKKAWIDLLSAKANHRVRRKDILKDTLKDAQSTYKDTKMRAKECVERRKNEIKERYDRCRNSEVRDWCGLKEDVVTGVERGRLRWFGHLEGMYGNRMTKQIYRANVCEGKIGKSRPRKSYADQIGGILKKGQILSILNRRTCMKRLMDFSEASEIYEDRTTWKSIFSAYPSGKQEPQLYETDGGNQSKNLTVHLLVVKIEQSTVPFGGIAVDH